MILVFDTETTGLTLHSDADPSKQPRIIELAAMMVSPKDGSIVDELELLIHPGCDIPEDATKINGISNAMVQDAPKFLTALATIKPFFKKGKWVVAHNLPFDKAMVMNELRRAEERKFPWPANELCTVGLYQPEWGRNVKLIDLYEAKLGRKYEQTHRGLDDVRALVEIIQAERLWEIMQ